MYWVPSSLTLLTYAPASLMKLSLTSALAWSGLILVWPWPPEFPDPEPEPEPEPETPAE